MAFVPIDSVISFSELNRKRFSDVGIVNCVYVDRLALYNVSKNIVNDLLVYRGIVSTGNTELTIYVDCTSDAFFWLNSVYLNYKIVENGKTNTLDIMIDFKKSLEYMMLSETMLNNPTVVSAYRTYWKRCLHSIGKQIGVNLLESEV